MKITIKGKDETASLGSLSWSTDDETNGEEMDFSSIKLHDIGSHIKVTDGGAVRFYGVIVSMEENTKPPHTYKAMDFSYNLKGDEIIQFKKIAADKAIKKLLEKSGISCKVCAIPTKISKIYKGTLVEILKDILKIAKKDQGKTYYYEVNGNKVIVEEKEKVKIKPKFVISGDSSISRSITELRNEVVVAKNNKILATAKDDKSVKSLGTIRYVDDNSNVTKAKAAGEAKSQLKKLNRSTATKSLTLLVSEGYWDIRKNRLIKLEGGGLSGWYNIRSAKHSIDGKIHMCEIEVGWSGKIKS